MKLIKNELFKASRSRKLYIFMLIAIAVEMAVMIQIRYNSFALDTPEVSGQSFPLMLLGNFSYFIVIFTSVFISDQWIDEYRSGTLKLTLLRSVSRISLFNAKLIAFCVCSAALIGFILASAYVTGTIAFGWGEAAVIHGTKYAPLAGIFLNLKAAAMSLFPVIGLGMLVSFLAIWTDHIGITIGGTMGLVMASQILETAKDFKTFSIFYLMRSFYQDGIGGWLQDPFLKHAAIIAAYVIVFYIGGFFLFRRKDLSV